MDFAGRVVPHLVGVAGDDERQQVFLEREGDRCIDARVAGVKVVEVVHGVGRWWDLHVSLPRLVV